ncbi:MAG TPA: nicotinate-nucleotide adenylyltransferase [Micropepsaceae bacterium]|nr:nicotinate-nucleotide adenylyltransferase [Micropepsaceae bacterium]
MNLRSRMNWVRPPGPLAEGMRVGLLGGSFNPAHAGHIYASELALKRLRLDYVWWLVSPQNPLKDAAGMAGFDTRLTQAKAFVRHPHIVVTGIEDALGTRFTVDTLRALTHRFAEIRFVWLMGSDNLLQLPRWRDWQAIFALVPIAVVVRPGSALSARTSKAASRFRDFYLPPGRHFSVMEPPAWTILDSKRHPGSATALRTRPGLAKAPALW